MHCLLIFFLIFIPSNNAFIDYDILLINGDPKIQAQAIANASSVNFNNGPTTEFTICLWVIVQDDRQHYLVSYYAANGFKMGITLNSTYTMVSVFADAKEQQGSFLKPNEWTHVCFQWSSSKGRARLFIDGEIKAIWTDWRVNQSLPTTNPILVLGNAFAFGAIPTYSMQGRISQFDMWNRSFSSGFVRDIYGCSSEMERGNIVAWQEVEWIYQNGAMEDTSTLPCLEDYYDYYYDYYDNYNYGYYDYYGYNDYQFNNNNNDAMENHLENLLQWMLLANAGGHDVSNNNNINIVSPGKK